MEQQKFNKKAPADPQKFGKRVQELLYRNDLPQTKLAAHLGITDGYLSQILHGRHAKSKLVKACILFLVDNEAIDERQSVRELLEWAGGEDFVEADWMIWPLNRLVEDTTLPQRFIGQRPKSSISPFDEEAARARYLEQVIRWYSFLRLPAGPLKTLPLSSVFQSLPLRQEGFLPEELAYEDRRALLDELTRGEDDPRLMIPENRSLNAHREKGEQVSSTLANGGFDALNKSAGQRMVIVGPAGSGKTTLLNYFMIEIARQAQANLTDLLPLFISLPEFVVTGLSLEDYLLGIVAMLGVDKRYAFALEKAVKAGKVFICLDTLDQIPSPRRREVITWINIQAGEPGNVWIISSRFNEYGGAQFLPQFPEWELTPLTHQAREQLAQGLFSELAQRTSDGANAQLPTSSQFVSALENHRQAAHWGRNPLLFSLALNSFHRTGAFPSSRVALYKETIAALVATHQENRSKQVALQRAVAALALRSYEERQRLLIRGTLHEHVVAIRKDQEEIWDVDEMTQALINSGILEVVAKDTYGFWHQTFQEYFASAELARRLIHQRTRQASWNFVWQKRLSGRWTEVLRLMVGVLVQEYAPQDGIPIALFCLRELVRQRMQTHGDVGDLGLALAIKSLGEIGEQTWFWHDPGWLQLEEEVAHSWTEALIETVRRNQTVRQRRLLQLIGDLCQLKPSTISSLIEELEAKTQVGNAQTREVLIFALGKFACYAPVQLLSQALGDRHKIVRAAAVKALIAMGNNAPVNDLCKALQSEQVLLREAATQVIGGLRRPDLQEEMLQGLSDESWKVQLATVQALGELGEHAPRDKLVDCLQNENDIVRYAAVEALGELGNSMPVEKLVEALDDPDDWVRGAIIDVLGEKTPADRLVDAVLNPVKMLLPLRTSADAAREVLARQGEQALFEMLRAYGIPDDQELQDLVMFIIDPESQQELSPEEILEALHGNHEENRRRAVRILSERGERKLLEAVLTSRETVHQITRATALRMVGKLHEPLLIDEAVQALDDPDPKIRLAAIKALKDLGEQVPQKIVSIEKLLEDEDRQIATFALEVLWHGANGVPITSSLLESLLWFASQEESLDNLDARDVARACLRKLGHRIAPSLIASLVGHEEPAMRMATLQELWSIIPLEDIHKAFTDEDEDVCDAARFALFRRTRKEQPTKYSNVAFSIHTNAEKYIEVQFLKEVCGEAVLHDLPQVKEATIKDFAEWDPLLFGNGEQLIDTSRPLDSYTQAQLDLSAELLEKTAELLRMHAPEEKLRDALNHEHENVRRIAVQALKGHLSKEQLFMALDDEAPIVRKEALKAFDIDTPMEQLLYMLHDDEIREIALEILEKIVPRLPETQLIEALENKERTMRVSALRALRQRAPKEKLLAALGDSAEEVRLTALDILLQHYPEMCAFLVKEVTTVLIEAKPSTLLGSAAQSYILDLISQMEPLSSTLQDKLIELLDWPYWEVQMKAARILGTLYRNIPQGVIECLFALRKETVSQTVREAADDALAELLSLERGQGASLT